MDPIFELLMHLYDGRPPPLAWLLKWSQHGEPVTAAWSVSRAPGSMMELLRLAQCGGDFAKAGEAVRRWDRYEDESVFKYDSLCELIRSAVPQPPTLEKLLSLPRVGAPPATAHNR